MPMELETPTAYRKRLELFLTQPDTLDVICSFVSNGGTVVELCEMRNFRMGDVMNWIHKDAVRDDRHRLALNDRDEWTRDALMTELKRIAFTDIRDAYDDNGSLKPIKELPTSIAKCISSIEVDELWEGRGRDAKQTGFTKKVRMYDKLKAIEMVGKQIGMFNDKQHIVVEKYEDLIAKIK